MMEQTTSKTFLDGETVLLSLAGEMAGSIATSGDEQEHSISADPVSTSTNDHESTSSSTKGSSTQDIEHDLKRKILQEEERNVRRARVLVGITLIVCAATVICGVYFFTIESDQFAFEAEVRTDEKQPILQNYNCQTTQAHHMI